MHIFNNFSKSNLADIFNTDQAKKLEDSDSDLKYIPPKPEQNIKTTEKPNWNTGIAKVVNAFKLYGYGYFYPLNNFYKVYLSE